MCQTKFITKKYTGKHFKNDTRKKAIKKKETNKVPKRPFTVIPIYVSGNKIFTYNVCRNDRDVESLIYVLKQI